MEQAEGTDFLQAIGQHGLQASAEQLHDVEAGGAGTPTAHCPGGEGARALRERDNAAVREGDLEDIRGEGGEGGVSVGMGLTVDVPGESPDLRGEGLEQSGLAHLCCAEGAGEGRERFDRDKDGGAGGAPCRAVFGETAARDEVVDRRVGRELSAPGMQDSGAPRESGAEEARIFGQPLESRGRGLQQGLGSQGVVRAAQGTQGRRDRAGQETVRSWELAGQVRLEPWVRCILLALRTGPVATSTSDAGLFPTARARREAGAGTAALTRVDGADALTVCEGQRGLALQVLGGKGGEEIAAGGPGRSPCMRAWRRSYASSCPWWGRWRESRGVASGGCPR
jgi:hypothetical protein